MQIETNMEGENEMVVKRLSVPLGLEELMESLTKEVLRRKPADVYAFASEHFAQLLSLRDTGCYKTSFMKIKKTPSQISAESLDGTRGTKAQAPIKIKSAMLGTMTKIPRRKSPAPKSFIGSNPKPESVSPRSKSIILESPTLKSDRARQILDKHMAKKQGDPKKVNARSKMVTPQNDLDVIGNRKSATGNKTKQIKSLRSGEKKSQAKNDRTPGKLPLAAGEGPKDHENETPKENKEFDESKGAALPKSETATKEELKPTEELKKEDLKQEMQNNSASEEKTKEEIIEEKEENVVERKLSKGETFDEDNALSMTSETENQKDNAVLDEERRAEVIEDDTKVVTSEAAEIKNNLNSKEYEKIVEEEANKEDGQIDTGKLLTQRKSAQKEDGDKEEITLTKTERESENESKVITGGIENDLKSTVDNSSKISDASSEEMPITSEAAEIKNNLNSKEHEKIIEEGTNKGDGQIDTEKLLPEQKLAQREDGGKEEMTSTKTETESEKRESEIENDLKSTVDNPSKAIAGNESEDNIERLENAAVKIQASFRGYQSRKKLLVKTNPKPQDLPNATGQEENVKAQDILALRESVPISKEEVVVKTVEQTELAPETSNDLENEIEPSDKNDTDVKKGELERKNVTLETLDSPAIDGPFKEEKDVNPKANHVLAEENIAQAEVEKDQTTEKIKENLPNDEEPEDLLTKSTNAAVKIQAYVRGHLARQKSIYRNNSDLNLTKSEETDVTNDENNNDEKKPIVHPPEADDNTDSKKIGTETSESFRKTFVETISESDQDEAQAKELTKAFVEYERQNYQADSTVQLRKFKSIKNGNGALDTKELSQEKMVSDGRPKSVESILQEAPAEELIAPELSQEKTNGLRANSKSGDGKEIGNSKSAEKVLDGEVTEKLTTRKVSKEDGLEISVGESKVEEGKAVFDDSLKANSSTTVEDLVSVEDAAVKIQSLWRGHKIRKHIKNVELKDLQKPTECDELPGDRLSVEDLIKAATVIQALFRGYSVRKHFVIGTMDKSFRKGKSFDEKLPTVLEVEDDDNEDGPKIKANEGNFASTKDPNEEENASKEDLVTRKEDDEKISSTKRSDEEERSEEVKKLDNEEVLGALKQLEHVSIPPKSGTPPLEQNLSTSDGPNESQEIPEIKKSGQIHSGGEITSNIHDDLAEIANSIKEDVVKLKQVLGDDTITKNEDGREEKRRGEEEEEKKDGDANEGDAHLLDLASSMKEDAQKLRETLSNEAKMKDADGLNGKEATNEVDPENMSRPVSKESTTSADSVDTVIFNDQRPRGRPIRADTVLPENYIQDNLETSMQNLSMDQFDDLSSGSIDDKQIINVEDDGFTSQTQSPVKHEVKFRVLGELKEDSGEDDSGSASEREKKLGEVKEQSGDIVTDVIDTAAKKIQKFFKQNRGKRSTAEVLKQTDSVQSQGSLNSSEDVSGGATVTSEDKSGAATTIQKTYRGYRVRRDLQNRNGDDAEYDEKEKDIDKEITNLLKSITEPVRRAFSADKNKVETDEKVELKQSGDEPNSVYIPLRDYSSEERADSQELVVPSKGRAGSKVDIYLPLFNRESASGDADNSVSSTSTSKTLTTGEYSAEDVSDSRKSIENKLEFEQKHAASADRENSVNGLNVEEDAEQNRTGTTPKVEDHKDTKQQRIEDNTEMGKQEEILAERREKTKLQKSEEKNQSNEETANAAITQYINSLIEPIKQAFSADKNRADRKTDKVADVQTSVKDEGPIYIPLRDYSEENLQQSGPDELGFRSDRKKRGALDDDPETTLAKTGQKIVEGSKSDEKHEPTSTSAPDLPRLELKPEENFSGMKEEFKKTGNLNELEAQILDELGLTEGGSEHKSESDLGRKTQDFGSRHSALVSVHEAKTEPQNSEDAKNGSKTENFPDDQKGRKLNGTERKKEIESTTEFQGQIGGSLAQIAQNSEAGEEIIKTEDLQTAPATGDIEKEALSQIGPDETSPKKMADTSQRADNSSTVSNGKRLEENIVRKDKANEEKGVKQEEKSFENKHTDQIEKENVNNILNEKIKEDKSETGEQKNQNPLSLTLSLKQSSEDIEMKQVTEKFEECKDQKKVESNSAMVLPNKTDQNVTDFTPKESVEEEKREKIEDSPRENATEEVTDVRTKDEEQSTEIKGGGGEEKQAEGEEKQTELTSIVGENIEILKPIEEDQLEMKQEYAPEGSNKSDDEKSNSKTETNGESQSEKDNDVADVQKKLDPYTSSDITIDENKGEHEITDSQQLKTVEAVANESTGTDVKEISQEKVVTDPSVPSSKDKASEIPKGDGEEAIAKLESQIIPIDDVKSEGKAQDVIGISVAESQRREDLAISVGGSEKANVMRNQESLSESDEKRRPRQSELNETTKTETLSSENDIPQKEEVTSAKPGGHHVSTTKSTEFETSISNQEESDLKAVTDGKNSEIAKLQETNMMIEEEKSKDSKILFESKENKLPHVEEGEGSLKAIETQGLNAENSQKNIVHEGGPTLSENEGVQQVGIEEDVIGKPEDVNLAADGVKKDMDTDEDKLRDVGEINDENSKLVGSITEDVQATVERTKTTEEDHQRSKIEETDGKVTIKNDDATAEVDIKNDEDLKGDFVQNIANKEETFDVTSEKQSVGDSKFGATVTVENIQAKAAELAKAGQEGNKQSSEVHESDETTAVKEDAATPTHKGEDIIKNVDSEKDEAVGQKYEIMEDTKEFDQRDNKEFDQKKNTDQLLLEDVKKQSIDEATSVKPADKEKEEFAMAEASQSIDDKQQMSHADNNKHLGDIKQEENQRMIEKYTNAKQVQEDVSKEIEKENLAQAKTRPTSSKAGEEIEEAKIHVPDASANVDGGKTEDLEEIPQIPVTKKEEGVSSSNITHTVASELEEESRTPIVTSESRKEENGKQNGEGKQRSEDVTSQIDNSEGETDIKEKENSNVGKTDEIVKEESMNERDAESKEEETIPTLDITKEESKIPQIPVTESHAELKKEESTIASQFAESRDTYELSKDENEKDKLRSEDEIAQIDNSKTETDIKEESLSLVSVANTGESKNEQDTGSKEEESLAALDITKEESKKEASTTPMEERIIEKTQEGESVPEGTTHEATPVANSKIEVNVLDGNLKVEGEIVDKETYPKFEPPSKEENAPSDELVKEEDKHQSNGEDQKEIIQVTKSTNEEVKEENEDVVDSLDEGIKSAGKPQSDSEVFDDGKVKSSSVTSDFGPESILQVEANKSAPFYLHQESYSKSPTTSQEKAFAEALKQDFEKTKVEDGERLLHSSEFHDSIPLNVPSEKKKDAADPAAGPQFLTHSSELHDSIIPLVLQMNDAPAGTKTVTSGRKASVSVGAQASDKDVSAAREDAPDNAQHSRRSFGTDMEKRNNSAIVRKSMEVEAATKIQASFRGYQVRKQLKNRKTGGAISSNRRSSRRKSSGRISDSKRASIQNKNPSQLEQESATKIQAGIRGFLVRRRQKKEKTNKTPESG